MSTENSHGVVIGDGSSYIRLARIGRPTGWAVSALIAVKAGPFVGEVDDDMLVGVGDFCEQLSHLYKTLNGQAELTSYEKLKLVVSGNGRGVMSVQVELYGAHTPMSLLSFEFDVDQTYLPKIIKELREEFPEG